MGNSPHELQGWNVRYVQNIDDKYFGNIDIYQNEERAYISMVRRTFAKNGDDRMLNDFLKTLDFVEQDINHKNKFIVPVLHKKLKEQNQLCIVYHVYEIYCQYFNFTLLDMIKHKKTMDIQELWLCFLWLLQLSIKIKEAGFMVEGGFTLDKIFLTLKGLPVIYVHHLLVKPEQVFGRRQGDSMLKDIGYCMLQLACLTQINRTENIELFIRKCEKINDKLGGFIREILGNHEECDEKNIIADIQSLKECSKISIANEIKLNKFKYIIPNPEQQKRKTEPSQNKSNKPIIINSLQGRKKENSLKDSHRKNILTIIESQNTKMFDLKGKDYLMEFQRKKKESELQKQRLTIRREKLLSSSEKENKENIIGNSIKSVKATNANRQSWTRKLITQQLKNSFRK